MLIHLVHVAALANFAYALYFDIYLVKLPKSQPRHDFGGQWKYLTFWNLWIQFAYFSISFINSFVGSHAQHKSEATKLQKVRDYFFSTVAFPIGIFVTVMFWTLYAIDRELVFPVELDKYFPVYVNHMLHTSVMPLQILELCLLYHIYPRKWVGMATTAAFCFVYLSWTLIVAYVGGIWVYPIFEVLGPVQRVLFMLACAGFGGILYFFGYFANQTIWARHVQPQPGQSKKAVAKAKKTRLD